ncbi:unnamed protein product [Parajaminaea phylloscopi]
MYCKVLERIWSPKTNRDAGEGNGRCAQLDCTAHACTEAGGAKRLPKDGWVSYAGGRKGGGGGASDQPTVVIVGAVVQPRRDASCAQTAERSKKRIDPGISNAQRSPTL